MRKIVLSAVLGIGALAALVATPTQAKAFWPNGGISSIQVGPYGNTTVWGSTYYRWSATGTQARWMLSTAPAYRTTFTPYSFSRQWVGRGTVGWTYNPIFGLNYTVTTPAMAGYSFSSYYGFTQYAIPSQTYTVPAGYVIP